MVRALDGAGHDVVALGVGGHRRFAGAVRSVRIRPSNSGTLVATEVAAGPWSGLAPGLLAFWHNDKLIRALRVEHQRAPLDAVVERLTPFSYGIEAICNKLEIPHVFEVRPPAPWQAWSGLDTEMQRAARAVHDFAVRRTRMLFAAGDALAAEYRAVTSVPVRALPAGQPTLPAARPTLRGPKVVGLAGPLNALADLPLVAAAAELLPAGIRVAAPAGRRFDAGLLMPASRPDRNPARLAGYIAAGLPVVVSRGSLGDRLLPYDRKAVYDVDDPHSLAAAMVRAAGLPIRESPTPLDRWMLDAEVISEGLEHLRRG
ncbi:MAG: hypothetical protein NVS9B1_04320 [Candidatus Dormibacteraceae bacterium]